MGGLDPPIQGRHARNVPSGFVYILASDRNGTLYTGVTRLVWFEEYPLYADAIRRETAMKRWKRAWKLALIEKCNPQWKDLLETWNA